MPVAGTKLVAADGRIYGSGLARLAHWLQKLEAQGRGLVQGIGVA